MKKLLTVTMILCFITSSVNASSVHGDFEGSPIVSVQSNGKDLQVEDVPAINYKGRTMVPIYMFKQLGADVTWNDSSYSVNVKIPEKSADVPAKTEEDSNAKETALLKDLYKWLSDTDMAIWMVAVKFQQYADADLTSNQEFLLDNDITELNKMYEESMKYSLEKANDIKEKNYITDILQKQNDALTQVSNTKDILKLWLKQKSETQILNSYKVSLANSLTKTQKNLTFTNKCLHELIVNEYKKSQNPS
ncbi:hypothetical protein HQN89_22070 [Paenibacillus frigoriresistens]|uniref:stalk domain-containing protein n=1 Tax=Paenibacillus alginolyticus TaxID=59839 RepID=UPI001566CEC8|nr:stalk domain-containing protein [Paenibacillus frigoriresistens]NRF93635.1 hypothetical protein [Paenibacillus frigoriresistens]